MTAICHSRTTGSQIRGSVQSPHPRLDMWKYFGSIAIGACTYRWLRAQSVGYTPNSSNGQRAPSCRRPPGWRRLPDYVIGPEDQLSVVFFHDKDMSSDVVVRPDGKISLPLLNEVQASGLTPEQLRAVVSEQAKQFMRRIRKASVVVRQINSFCGKCLLTAPLSKSRATIRCSGRRPSCS